MKTENLSDKEAIEKMKEMVNNIKIAILLTSSGALPLGANPMSTRKIEEDGSIWFLSSLNSDHYKNIRSNKWVQLIYSHPEKMQFLSIYGKANIRDHQNKLKELYTKEDDLWFDGIDDTELIAIKVVPESVFYWDKKQNKLIELIQKITDTNPSKESGDKVKGEINL